MSLLTRLSLICFVSLGLLFPRSAFAYSKKQEDRAKLCKEIYQKIARTIQDSRKAPTFNFLYTEYEPVYNAYYDPSNHTINLEEGIYDLADDFGDDSINVLALVLGHELAHFYKDHGWGMAFGTANDNLEISEKIYDLEITAEMRTKMETEADFFGGLFGYLAGYNTLEVGKKFYTKLYDEADLPAHLPGYPDKGDREGIAANSQRMLKELIPVFEAGNYLTVINHFEEASSCYDEVIKTFPSRELYNNSGVCLALEAIPLFEPKDLRFFYPLGLDLSTRLDQGGTKGMTETPEEKRERLMGDARQMLETAVKVDKDYAAGYVNLSLVMSLNNEPELALGYAGKGLKFAEADKNKFLAANAHIARGIAHALSEEEDEATEEFTAAKAGNKNAAEINLAALSNPAGRSPYALSGQASGEKTSAVEETIEDADPSLLEVILDDPTVTEIVRQNDDRPRIKVYGQSDEAYRAVMVKTYGVPRTSIGFLATQPDYAGKSARGIAIGAGMAQVKAAYGTPARECTGIRERFLVYEKARIIFMLDWEDKVTGWILYSN
ncbi:MAG: metalloendopeptidase [Bacteroidia bacterium]|nr:metalloendopeptidase [Bacteroidia bacterium]